MNLVLDQDLKVGEMTVARAGSVAVATVSHADRAGMLGRPGDPDEAFECLKEQNDSMVRSRIVYASANKEGHFWDIGLINKRVNTGVRARHTAVGLREQGPKR